MIEGVLFINRYQVIETLDVRSVGKQKVVVDCMLNDHITYHFYYIKDQKGNFEFVSNRPLLKASNHEEIITELRDNNKLKFLMV